MKQAGNHYYEFEAFRLDATARLLWRAERMVPLAPKVAETLLALVANHGRMLEKEELLKTLWPDTYVEESNLTNYISQLRKVLGDETAAPRFIETIPRRGYRFIAPVAEVREPPPGATPQAENALAVAPPPAEPAPAKPAQVEVVPPRRRWLWPSAVAALVLVLTVGAYGLVKLWHARAATGLPFSHVELARLTQAGVTERIALSPDGNLFAQVVTDKGRQALEIRQVNAATGLQLLPFAARRYQGLAFAPDGAQLYFQAYELTSPVGALYRMPALGGAAQRLIEDADSAPGLSPDGRRVAFLRNDPAARECSLIVARAEGGDEHKLLTRKLPEAFNLGAAPAWSPAGDVIALVATREDGFAVTMSIVTVRLADLTARVVGAVKPWIGNVAWTARGDGLLATALAPDAPAKVGQLWRLDYPAGTERRLTNDLHLYSGLSVAAHDRALLSIQSARGARLWAAPDGDPARARSLSTGSGGFCGELRGLTALPDGRIVYGGGADGQSDIWAVERDGRNPTPLTHNPQPDFWPSASADGRVIAFLSTRTDEGPQVWRMAADGSRPTQLTHERGVSHPSIAPDGRWVVYAATGPDGPPNLWKISVDGGAPLRLTEQPSSHPVVSPDGQWIACYFAAPPQRRRKLAIIPFSGGAPVKTFDTRPLPEWDWVQWTPDGRALAFIHTQNGVSNIHAQPVDGSPARQLTHFTADQLFRFIWARDGQTLIYEQGRTVSDAVLLKALP